MVGWIRRWMFPDSEGNESGPDSPKRQREASLYEFKALTFEKCPVIKTKDITSDLEPQSRSGHRIVCENDNIYSFGGYFSRGSTQELLKELWCYNVAECRWKRLPNYGSVPEELASHSVVLYGNYLVVFGGSGIPFGQSSSNVMSICDLRTLQWKTIETDGDAPIPRYGQGVLLDNKTNSFFVIGGTSGHEYSMDVHKLDMKTFTWEIYYKSVPGGDIDEPEARYRHDVAFDGSFIYILGGGTATGVFDLCQVPAFDIKQRRWKKFQTIPDGQTFPSPRKCQGSVQLGDEVFMCGGFDGSNIFSDLWKLCLRTMTWTQISFARMPVPLYFHATCITNAGCMYIFGGVNSIQRGTRTNEIFKIWVKVPKLKELCWQALLHYNESIIKMSCYELKEMGLPKEFVDRAHPCPPCGQTVSISKHWSMDSLPSYSDLEVETEEASL